MPQNNTNSGGNQGTGNEAENTKKNQLDFANSDISIGSISGADPAGETQTAELAQKDAQPVDIDLGGSGIDLGAATTPAVEQKNDTVGEAGKDVEKQKKIVLDVESGIDVGSAMVDGKPAVVTSAEKPKEDKNVFEKRMKKLDEKLKQKSHKIKKKKAEKKGPVMKYEQKSNRLFNIIKESKKSFGDRLASLATYFVFALLIFLGSLYFDRIILTTQDYSADLPLVLAIESGAQVQLAGDNEQINAGDEYVITIGNTIKTGATSDTILDFAGYGLLRLDANTEIVVDNYSLDGDTFEFTLKSGKVWGNTLFDNYDLIVKTKSSLVMPKTSSFNIEYDGSKTDIYADKHDLYVAITNEGNFLNSYWLAEGNKTQILDSKVSDKADTIARLLYSKLTKEFQYSRISTKKLKENPWLALQREKDLIYIDELTSDSLTSIQTQGLKALSTSSIRFQTKSLMADLRKAFTFSESKKIANILEGVFENLHDAKYLFYQGNEIDAKVRLNLFAGDINNPQYQSDEFFQTMLFEKLEDEYASLAFVIPGEDLYPVKEEIIKQILTGSTRNFLKRDDTFDYLALKLNDVADSAKLYPADAAQAFSVYFDFYKGAIVKYKNNLTEVKENIIRHNILVDNILYQYPDVYNLGFFESKSEMENDYILALLTSNDKKEQRQTFISAKIDLLNRIRYFLFNDEINADQARNIVYLLTQDIEELQKGITDASAVTELFAKRLDDFGTFWDYLNTPEYAMSKLHGSSHDTRYEEFKKLHEESMSFLQIQSEILGEVTQEKLTPESVLEEAETELILAGINDIQFGYYEDTKVYRIPIVSAKAGGIEFRAVYDWDRKLLSSIIVGDKIVSQDGIKISKAKKLIYESIQQSSSVTTTSNVTSQPETPVDDLDKVKNVAVVFLVGKFTKLEVQIADVNVTITDFKAGEYRVENVSYADYKEAIFSFNYITLNDEISNLAIVVEEEDVTINGPIFSKDLKGIVGKFYNEVMADE